MSLIFLFLGVSSLIGGTGWAIYAWIFLGIFGIVDSATVEPLNVNGLVWGILWTAVLAKLCVVGSCLLGMLFLSVAKKIAE